MNHTFLGFYIYMVMSHATVINSLSETSPNLDGLVNVFFLRTVLGKTGWIKFKVHRLLLRIPTLKQVYRLLEDSSAI